MCVRINSGTEAEPPQMVSEGQGTGLYRSGRLAFRPVAVRTAWLPAQVLPETCFQEADLV